MKGVRIMVWVNAQVSDEALKYVNPSDLYVRFPGGIEIVGMDSHTVIAENITHETVSAELDDEAE